MQHVKLTSHIACVGGRTRSGLRRWQGRRQKYRSCCRRRRRCCSGARCHRGRRGLLVGRHVLGGRGVHAAEGDPHGPHHQQERHRGAASGSQLAALLGQVVRGAQPVSGCMPGRMSLVGREKWCDSDCLILMLRIPCSYLSNSSCIRSWLQ